MSYQTKKELQEGFYYTLFVFVLLFLSTVPFLNLIAIWLIPLPFFLIGAIKNWVTLVPVLVLYIGISIYILFISPFVFFFLWLCFFVGFSMGKLYKEPRKPAEDVVLGGFIAGSVCFLISLYIGQSFYKAGSLLQKQWDDIMKNSTLTSLGVSVEEVTPIQILPICFFMVMTVIVLLNMWVGRRWLLYRGFPGKYLPRFYNWNVSRLFLYIYFFVIIFPWVIGNVDDSTDAYLVSLKFILYIVFLIQGLTVFAYVLYIYKWKRYWIIPVIFLSGTSAGILIYIIGILDTGLRLKKRMKENLKG